jgi:hypothetical protein
MMSKPVRWALGLTLLGTAAVSFLPDDEATPAGAQRPAGAAAATRSQRTAPGPATALTRAAAALPAGWPAGPQARDEGDPRHLPAPALAAWSESPSRKDAAVVARAASAVVAPPPVVVQRPQAPYRLIGLVEEGGVVRALLLADQKTLVVAAGEAIDTQWRVESIVGREVTLRTLDGTDSQTLSFKPA